VAVLWWRLGRPPLEALGTVSLFLFITLVTVVLTPPGPAADDPVTPAPAGSPLRWPTGRAWLWAQLAVTLAVIGLTTWSGLAFHQAVAADAGPTWWTGFLAAVGDATAGWRGGRPPQWVTNPVAYVLIPLPLLLLAGARPGGLGFGRGRSVWKVCAAIGLPLAATGVVAAGPAAWLREAVSNFFQNGFFEEFLFRGALQTRLARLWTPAWALVAQALLFGLWHLGLGWAQTADWPAAIASTLVYQSLMGLALGLVFQRTRNLAAPSLIHVLLNSMGV
jgi:membrane protease YdiL (CAAX protease family)